MRVLPTSNALVLFFPNAPLSRLWADGTELTLLGSGFPQDVLPLPYNRLPGSAEGQIRQAVYNLGEDSAGIALEFETDSPSIAVR